MKILKLLYKYWMKFAHLLATVNGFIILSLFYIVVIGLYSLPLHVIKLFTGKKETPASFWQEKNKEEKTLDQARYQF